MKDTPRRKEKDPPIHSDLGQAREIPRCQPNENVDAPKRQQEAEDSTHHPEKHIFGQMLPYQSTATCAQHRANRDFALS